MSQGLPVQRLISININLSPTAIPTANFDTLLIIGDSNVIPVVQRIRSYDTLGEVATDFGTTVPEYYAAQLFFGQNPQPAQVYIGRWAHNATHGSLLGGPLSASAQAISNFTGITTGSFTISLNGTSHNITGLDFSGQTNLNGVASVLQTALVGALAATTCVWNQTYNQFVITAPTTGTGSTTSFATPEGAGVDMSAQLCLTAATGAVLNPGIAAESALACVTIMDGLRQYWYGLDFDCPDIVDADRLAIAAYIEGSANAHAYGVTTQEPAAITSPDTTSIGYQFKQLGYNRTFTQYSSTTAYAVASFFGRALTVDFLANNSTITMMYQQEPGVAPEALTSNQSDTLNANNYNYFATYNNGASILVNGVMASGVFFDTLMGTDWLGNDIQTSVFNLFYTAKTKEPQTNAGTNQLVSTITGSLDRGVNNGLLAPGTWQAPGFGIISTGQFLPLGYYVYAPDIATQSEAARAARKSVPIQIAAKGAGAIQTANITINFNP